MTDILNSHATALDQELQQRAAEYIFLSAPQVGLSSLIEVAMGSVLFRKFLTSLTLPTPPQLSGIKSTVLEMMPHFTERESVVQKTLTKNLGDAMPVVC